MRDEMRAMRDEIRVEMCDSKQHLQNGIDANDRHLQMLAFALGGSSEESYEATQKRFYKKLPKATGSDRLIQLACLQLMYDFDTFCRAHNLTYWMLSGTLLGAVRHEGFVPWDDDIDLGMLRSDVETLFKLVADDDRFMITERFDYYAKCRQVRFCYRDERIPCFLDLFLFDLGTVGSETALGLIADDRARLKDALAGEVMLEAWSDENPFVDVDTAEGAIIKAAFTKLVETAYSDGGFLTDNPAYAKSVIWAVDNFEGNTGRSHNFEYETVFPVVELPFEGHRFSAPKDPESVLQTLYGEYLSLPRDITTHFAHIDKRLFDNQETRDAINKLAEQEESGGQAS